ncbi:hypothetical protein CCYA_CCYA03G0852 [Cyanidiococcus yangmingshanensis]|nr:hypothetical protein CCYA_CCYA03G0852 [Cyanidiococcus yangmingshanensis]
MSASNERTALLKQFASVMGSGSSETRPAPSLGTGQGATTSTASALTTPPDVRLDLSHSGSTNPVSTGSTLTTGVVLPGTTSGAVGNTNTSTPATTVPLPRKTGFRHRARLEREEPLREKAALGFLGRLSTYCTCTTYDLRALYAALQQVESKVSLSVRRLSRDLLLLQRRPSRRRIGAVRELLRSGDEANESRTATDDESLKYDETSLSTAARAGSRPRLWLRSTERVRGEPGEASWATMDGEGRLGPELTFDDDQEVEDVVAGAAIFFFSYGTLVCWGLSEAGEWAILDWLQPFENGQLSPAEMEKEFFTYTYSHEADKARIKNDNIMLPGALVERSRLVGVRRSTSQTTVLVPSGDSESNEWAQLEEADLSDEELVQVQAGVSHALAQSCKLGSFENSVDLLIERCGNVPLDLVRFGELHLGARDVMRMSGEVHLYRSYFNLQTDLLGTPDWFWENEQVEPLYERTARWLDTEKRGQLLNQRLEILKDLFMLFRDEVHVRTEHRLEWIIIILIVVEVVLQLFAMALGSRQSV